MLKKDNTQGFRRVDIQVSIFTMIVTVICCALISILFFKVSHNDMLRSMEDRVHAIQDFIVKNVDTKAFTDINSPEDMDTELYRNVHSAFKNVQDVTGVMYLYSGKRASDGSLVYVVDCIDPSAPDFRNPGDPIEPEIIPEMERALDGEEVLPHHIKSTEWGKIFIAYLPVQVDDTVVGVIGVEFEAEHQYNAYHFLLVAAPILALIICLICAVIANQLFKRISNPLYKDMYNTDYLTNLKSRNAFNIDMENLSASHRYTDIGFYVIDLNNLKKVNDTLGHESGDVYLQTAARSFRDTAGSNVTVYRTGGDEFVLIAIGDTQETMCQLTNDLILSFDQAKPQWGIDLSFSIGCALYDPDIDESLSATYKRADMMMYQRKREFHTQRLSC